MNANTRGHTELMRHDGRFMDQRTIDVINEEFGDWELFTSIHLVQNHTDWVLLKRKKESKGWQNYRLCLLGTQRKRTY